CLSRNSQLSHSEFGTRNSEFGRMSERDRGRNSQGRTARQGKRSAEWSCWDTDGALAGVESAAPAAAASERSESSRGSGGGAPRAVINAICFGDSGRSTRETD